MIPVAAAGGLAHGNAGLVGAHLAGELIDGLEQGLACQAGRGARGSSGHGSCGSSMEDQTLTGRQAKTCSGMSWGAPCEREIIIPIGDCAEIVP